MSADRPTPDARAAVVAEALAAHDGMPWLFTDDMIPSLTKDQREVYLSRAAAVLAALDAPATEPDMQRALERAQDHEVCPDSCPGHGWRYDDASEPDTTDPADGLSEGERGDRLEAMCDRLAESHVDLQDAIVTACNEVDLWRDQMPRTRENDTYANGRQDGATVAVRIVRAALSAHLRGEPDLARQRPTQQTSADSPCAVASCGHSLRRHELGGFCRADGCICGGFRPQQTSAERVVEAVEALADEWQRRAVARGDTGPDTAAHAASELRAALTTAREETPEG